MYFTTIKSLHFNHDGPGVPYKECEDHYVMCFDLTSTRESNQELYFPETHGSIRIELTFKQNLKQAVELLCLGEVLQTLFIKENGEAVKEV